MSVPPKSFTLEQSAAGHYLIPTPIQDRSGMIARLRLIGRSRPDGSMEPRPCGRCAYPFFGFVFMGSTTTEGHWCCEACGFEGLRGSQYEVLAYFQYAPAQPAPQVAEPDPAADLQAEREERERAAGGNMIERERARGRAFRERLNQDAGINREMFQRVNNPFDDYGNRYIAQPEAPWLIFDEPPRPAVDPPRYLHEVIAMDLDLNAIQRVNVHPDLNNPEEVDFDEILQHEEVDDDAQADWEWDAELDRLDRENENGP